MSDISNEKNLTFTRYESGERPEDWDLEEKIFQQDTSYKCPTYVHKTPPCQGSCPSGHEIRGWLAIARGMDKPPSEDMPWQEYAFNRMLEANPFPATMGRVCPAPCEDGCNRNKVDDFVGINALEQYVGDWANDNDVSIIGKLETETGKNVAVIGGGPAGLTAAMFLRRQGHGVTIFESHAELGGMMRYGIPGYRTPRQMLNIEIGRIINMGVELCMSTKVGEDISLDEIDEQFDAVFWGIGAQNGRGLPVEGFVGTPNCMNGVEFLDAFNQGWVKGTAQRVVVVGGGDTSVDVASVARRLGHITHSARKEHAGGAIIDFAAQDVAGSLRREGMQATLTSLFPIEEMTAAEREREDALREGIDIQDGVMPLEVIKNDDGLAVALKLCKCIMEGGRPVPVDGTEYQIECDIIISAIGQFGNFDGIENMDGGKGFINADGLYSVVDKEKHFAGGDILKPHLLTTAIGHGRIAAESIDHFLSGETLDKRPKVDVNHFSLLNELHRRGRDLEEYSHSETRGTDHEGFAVHNYEDRSDTQIVTHDELYKGHFPYDGREIRNEIHISEKDVLGNFEERIEGLTEEQAKHEGNRCMSCGMCFECNNCIIFCPQDAVFKVKKSEVTVGRYVDTDYDKCIGCHICMDVCPTGYIKMGLGG